MNNIAYCLIEEKIITGERPRLTYGVAAIEKCGDGEVPYILETVHDITPDREKLVLFIGEINERKLSPIHLRDAVEDFLTEVFTIA